MPSSVQDQRLQPAQIRYERGKAWARTIVVGEEDPAEFEALRDNLEQDFQPETYFERELVQRLAIYTLRLRRIPVFEATYMQFFERFARERAEQTRTYDPLERLSHSVIETQANAV